MWFYGGLLEAAIIKPHQFIGPPNSIPPHLLGRVIDRPIDVVVCFGGIALLIKNPGFRDFYIDVVKLIKIQIRSNF